MAIPSSIDSSFQFIRRNPFVLYSFVLIVAVTGVIFFNTYYFLGKFQGTVDDLLKSKAFLSESVFGTLIQDSLSDTDLLKRRLRQLKKEHADVTAIVILARSEEERNFRIIASTDVEDAGQKFSFQDSVSYPFRRTWSDQSATGYITNVNGERLWNVVKAIDRDDGERVGLVLFQVSLKEHDLFVQSAMRQVYAVALVSLMLVLGLIGIHVRLYGFAIRATKLEEVDRMKDDFISMASHELRSPLTVLRGYIDILKSGFLAKMPSVDSEEANRYLNNMEESVTATPCTSMIGVIKKPNTPYFSYTVAPAASAKTNTNYHSTQKPSALFFTTNAAAAKARRSAAGTTTTHRNLPQISPASQTSLKSTVLSLLANRGATH
jgi:signal transduction histidine kinase